MVESTWDDNWIPSASFSSNYQNGTERVRRRDEQLQRATPKDSGDDHKAKDEYDLQDNHEDINTMNTKDSIALFTANHLSTQSHRIL